MGKTTTFVDLDVHREGWHVQIPSYKEEYKDGDGGYHVENGRPAKPIGAYWMTLYRAGAAEATVSSSQKPGTDPRFWCRLVTSTPRS